MSGLEIEDYARVVLVTALKDKAWPEGFQRKSDMLEHLHASTFPELEKYDPRLSDLTIASLMEGLLQDLEAHSGITKKSDRFAGDYYIASLPHIQQFKTSFQQQSELNTTAMEIGFERFFSDAFAGFRQDPEGDRVDSSVVPAPPTDNRVITVSKAQLAQIEQPLVSVIDAVRSDNEIASHPAFRVRVLGQLKAGHELLLSGVVKAQLLYWVLLRALGELVEKYGKKAIGVAAGKLIELIVEELMKK